MELLDVGKHCNLISCRQLDFLPFKCADCRYSFCQEHSHPDEHNCQNKNATRIDIRIPTCQTCNKPVPLRSRTEDPEKRMADHLASHCTDIKVDHKVCTAPNCRTKILVPIACSSCGKQVCVKHRWPKEHNCQPQPKILKAVADSKKMLKAYRALVY
ncbi:hypothetical protein INT44_008277 [Umbelopsis vinacea]|uniref:AN1-type domain-containing protein n=1 Tax=Umbelopsis vinacea TaxID=44442 RepID=A0A8H7UJP8_9FUNG|nr:hypothetical protein INT44_008277 [Umbelopsis vinacea]KAI9283893.1 hypothetical protein BC943DRAFT_361848 [Umbelopsis sp. AD052]